MLISERTSLIINKIVQRMFYMNRICDNIVTNMSVNWSMNNASKIFHEGIAHKYPLLADLFSDIQDQFNVRTMYLETPADTVEYKTLLEAMQRALDELLVTNDLIIDAIQIAQEEEDINVKVLLEENLKKLTPYINQHILLRDKAALYGDNYYQFDNHPFLESSKHHTRFLIICFLKSLPKKV